MCHEDSIVTLTGPWSVADEASEITNGSFSLSVVLIRDAKWREFCSYLHTIGLRFCSVHCEVHNITFQVLCRKEPMSSVARYSIVSIILLLPVCLGKFTARRFDLRSPVYADGCQNFLCWEQVKWYKRTISIHIKCNSASVLFYCIARMSLISF